ncbi:MAG TPA: hypothetical protein VEM77_03725 [Thermoplasmata archaeon]|nr:hypothetical protein [Thermoplasmata archaeon]
MKAMMTITRLVMLALPSVVRTLERPTKPRTARRTTMEARESTQRSLSLAALTILLAESWGSFAGSKLITE